MDLSGGNTTRRCSARIEKLKSETPPSKMSRYREETEPKSKSNLKRKRPHKAVKPQNSSNIEKNTELKAQLEVVVETAKVKETKEIVETTEAAKNGGVAEVEGRSAHAVVRAAIRTFYTHYLHFVQVCFRFSCSFVSCLIFRK